MNKWMILVAAALACAGCFDNRAKPEDVPTVIGLQTLIATNRANIVRVILRGEKGEIPAAARGESVETMASGIGLLHRHPRHHLVFRRGRGRDVRESVC